MQPEAMVAATSDRLFDPATPPGGYTWWYADGLSADGAYGFTLIAFIGSVFSPYYAWSGRGDPFNHCAVNLALYGPDRQRWAMTERGRNDLHTDGRSLAIGPSCLSWDGTELTVDIAEHCAPVPRALRGQIRIRPRFLNARVFGIDTAGAHTWQPIAPSADVELSFHAPNLSWRGEAYLDTNRGTAPLETAFRYWDWSRVHQPGGRTAILYNTEERGGGTRSLGLLFGHDGYIETAPQLERADLPRSPVFRVKRTTRAAAGSGVRIVRTLEDAPFYTRSVIESDVLGPRGLGVHESFDGDRLSRALVKLMLPVRMPRRPLKR